MAISSVENSFVVSGGQTINLASMFATTASTSNPTYLVLTGLDRNEYTAGASDATGKLAGDGVTDSFVNTGGDARGVGIVFTYQASTGRYYNSTYGYFDQVTYTASSSSNDVTNLSLYGTSNLSLATANADNAASLAQLDAGGFLGSATVATQAGFSGTVPSQATPDSICAVADSFVGKAWNMNGCWVLASTIAAESGASLPVESSMIGIGGQANGEWIVAFNGSTQSGNWESLVKAGEIIVIGSASSGHITTCVSGSGSTAMLVDNITYVNSNGSIANAANDGSSSDVLISAPHAVSQEWTGVISSDVVIYELDTPVVSNLLTTDKLGANSKQILTQLFTAADPAGKSITEYQIYDTSSSNSFVVGTTTEAAHSAAGAITVSTLSSISLDAGSASGSDTVEVRAYNGSYWGDWESMQISVAATVAVTAPVLANQTAAQTWTQGQHVSLTIAANTFSDPNAEALSLSATQANGQALPSWLTFSASTDTFTGTVPTATSSLSLQVTATDTSGLSTSETIAVTVPASATPVVTTPAAPVTPATLTLAAQTANQTWADGQKISFTLPSGTFSDPHGLQMIYVAYELSGTPITSWIGFNSLTGTFSGTVPTNVSGTATVEVLAIDSSGAHATDTFSISLGKTTGSASLVGVMTAPHSPEMLHS